MPHSQRAVPRLRSTLIPIALGLALLVAGEVRARDGVHELSQTCAIDTGRGVGDAPGFPITLSSPGSDVLTSSLAVSSDVTAIELRADGIRVELNGFEISGAASCVPGSCSLGSSGAIMAATFPATGGARTQVVRGRITGFSGHCISLGAGSRVEDVAVEKCGGAGIVVGDASRAEGNIVRSVGHSGLVFQGSSSSFAHNVVADHDLAQARIAR
jgi:hypothetical protein